MTPDPINSLRSIPGYALASRASANHRQTFRLKEPIRLPAPDLGDGRPRRARELPAGTIVFVMGVAGWVRYQGQILFIIQADAIRLVGPESVVGELEEVEFDQAFPEEAARRAAWEAKMDAEMNAQLAAEGADELAPPPPPAPAPSKKEPRA